MKYLSLRMVAALFVLMGTVSHAKTPEASSNEIIYSKFNMSAVTGDCGGYTFTFNQQQPAQSYFQMYEGNCEAEKAPIEILQFDQKNKQITFLAVFTTFTQDGKKSFFKLKVSGTVGDKAFVGKICSGDQTVQASCKESEKLKLLKTKHPTP